MPPEVHEHYEIEIRERKKLCAVDALNRIFLETNRNLILSYFKNNFRFAQMLVHLCIQKNSWRQPRVLLKIK